MLNRRLHRKIFKGEKRANPDPRRVVIAREHLSMHGLDPQNASSTPNISFDLPDLQGGNIDEHFTRIGRNSAEPWLSICRTFEHSVLPVRPSRWLLQSGWTKYSVHNPPIAVPHPDLADRALAFDVETMPAYGPYPVIAVAASENAWYTWLSPWILGDTTHNSHMVNLGDSSVARVVVGHNVSYDRARIQEEYLLSGTSIRFVDTMALHIAVKGMTSGQRPAWTKFNKLKEMKDDMDELPAVMATAPESCVPQPLNDISQRWEEITTANSLARVAQLYSGSVMDKSIRSDFMNATPTDIRQNLSDYISYCAHDVHSTHTVYKRLLPLFLVTCPSPVSFAGMLAMGSSFLPVNESWKTYLEQAETKYRQLELSVTSRLQELANNALRMMESGLWKEDVWLSQLDWSPKTPRRNNVCESVTARPIPPAKASMANFKDVVPRWYTDLLTHGPFHARTKQRIVGTLLLLTSNGHPVTYSHDLGWHINTNGSVSAAPRKGSRSTKVQKIFSPQLLMLHCRAGFRTALRSLIAGRETNAVACAILRLARREVEIWRANSFQLDSDNPWLQSLDWNLDNQVELRARAPHSKQDPSGYAWPKWYWDLMKPQKKGQLLGPDVTVRSRVSPLLLRLRWNNHPLFHSKEHGWVYRVALQESSGQPGEPLFFSQEADACLAQASLSGLYMFFKLPHKDGSSANVGNPLGKTFIKYSQNGTLTSPEAVAKHALDMNAQCSYWISARDRVMNQMVLWHELPGRDLGFSIEEASHTWGMILPQVLTMGTVTRRATEKTWLTASNARKDRVGSELKAMVRAPKGWNFVGADVDSEELWISSVMGDSQFGFHGATAISWMTLEGTKAEKSDLHSKTATILGITRDAAKVFNYSRIYGAGMRHAQQLLLQNNPAMDSKAVKRLATDLYTATKGKRANIPNTALRHPFWFGGSESFLFNKLEDIALSEFPETPALGSGITCALRGQYLSNKFGQDFMTSRINWVVQSSGVDYLHLLVVAMGHLIKRYKIAARYLISVHDEVRFLVQHQDKYRAALALQIANLWTRSLFALRLGFDDLPQSVAFFSAVDVDYVLRKEVALTCETPSHPHRLLPGENLDIRTILDKTGHNMGNTAAKDVIHDDIVVSSCIEKGDDRPKTSLEYLKAQATDQSNEIRMLLRKEKGLAPNLNN